MLKYTKADLAHRNGCIMPQIWIAYKGNIYDVTESELFENGEHYFHLAGQDLTMEMEEAPHLDDVMEKFPIIGILVE